MSKLKKILIMAGGTGGHVFPGLAVAHAFREKGVEVEWLGTEKGLEAQWVPKSGISIHFISIGGLRGKGWKTKLLMPWKLGAAILQALGIIRRLNPDVVLGFGGFASGPGGLAAWILRKKLIIHEQNAKPGLTNRCLSRLASKVLEGFPNTFKQREKVVTVGNPIRKEIVAIGGASRGRDEARCSLLVLGGSLGAEAINRLLPRALAKLPEASRPMVYHQTGEKHFNDTVNAYKSAGVSAEVVPFIVEIDKAYAAADIVLCRAGALTVSELCAAGVGAILVPFPYAADDHQTTNAEFMAKNGAAVLVQQSALTEERLAALLEEVSGSTEKRAAMAKAAYELRAINATEKVTEICEEICH